MQADVSTNAHASRRPAGRAGQMHHDRGKAQRTEYQSRDRGRMVAAAVLLLRIRIRSLARRLARRVFAILPYPPTGDTKAVCQKSTCTQPTPILSSG